MLLVAPAAKAGLPMRTLPSDVLTMALTAPPGNFHDGEADDERFVGEL